MWSQSLPCDQWGSDSLSSLCVSRVPLASCCCCMDGFPFALVAQALLDALGWGQSFLNANSCVYFSRAARKTRRFLPHRSQIKKITNSCSSPSGKLGLFYVQPRLPRDQDFPSYPVYGGKGRGRKSLPKFCIGIFGVE